MKRSPMRRSSRNTGPDKATRDLVFSRDGDRCAACGTTFQLTIQHRKNRSAGGDNGPANLLTLCTRHNTALESDSLFAKVGRCSGWKVMSWWDPREMAVWYDIEGRWFLLTSDGRRVPTAAPERAA